MCRPVRNRFPTGYAAHFKGPLRSPFNFPRNRNFPGPRGMAGYATRHWPKGRGFPYSSWNRVQTPINLWANLRLIVFILFFCLDRDFFLFSLPLVSIILNYTFFLIPRLFNQLSFGCIRHTRLALVSINLRQFATPVLGGNSKWYDLVTASIVRLNCIFSMLAAVYNFDQKRHFMVTFELWQLDWSIESFMMRPTPLL